MKFPASRGLAPVVRMLDSDIPPDISLSNG